MDRSGNIAAHQVSAADAAQALGVERERGLDEADVTRRRQAHGYNELPQAKPPSHWALFARQFKEIVVAILLAAAVIALALGEWADAIVIVVLVALNALIGFFPEERAGRALAALRKLSTQRAKVLRGGQLSLIDARELVPGDLIELGAGDAIPADARLITSTAFSVQESALTGESLPADKDATTISAPDTTLGDRRGMTYMGTTATTGKASALVTATGSATELGKIADMLAREQPEPTPLQRRMAELGKLLTKLILALVAIIVVAQLFSGRPWLEVLLLAVSLAVAAVPEGMPAVVTIALALGLQRMARRNALIRTLPSVETLGSVTVICSDKTGTLTRNEMTVQAIVTAEARYEITGAGYAPKGQFRRAGNSFTPAEGDDLYHALLIGVRCNHAQLHAKPDGAWEIVGDPTEAALVVAAAKAGIASQAKILAEIPFDSDRKMMSVLVDDGRQQHVYCKGAPEAVLRACAFERRNGVVEPLSDARRAAITACAGQMAADAMRVLALAYSEDATAEIREQDLIFAGLAAMFDPPREEAAAAVQTCHQAGIRPVMITGDHPQTALAIARMLGIAADGDAAITGAALEAMSDDDLARQVLSASVFARVTAEHKLRIVRALRAGGQVVAMTGDGVNDAPAVKAADIGVAMGLAGTDVTKEASDMVLLDDNFASIVAAIEEGRGIFDNIRKFVQYLLSCNAGEVLFMFIAALARWPLPLTAIQILWVNLVTDGLPALALGVEPTEPGAMRRKPRPPAEPVVTKTGGIRMLAHAVLIAGVTVIAFRMIWRPGDPASLIRARTAAFCVLAVSQLFYSFSCRSLDKTMPQLGLFTNRKLLAAILVSGILQMAVVAAPFLRRTFDVTTNLGWQWATVLALSLLPVTLVELVKIARASRRSST